MFQFSTFFGTHNNDLHFIIVLYCFCILLFSLSNNFYLGSSSSKLWNVGAKTWTTGGAGCWKIPVPGNMILGLIGEQGPDKYQRFENMTKD